MSMKAKDKRKDGILPQRCPVSFLHSVRPMEDMLCPSGQANFEGCPQILNQKCVEFGSELMDTKTKHSLNVL